MFFDHASTTPCCEAAASLLARFATEDFGNPSSSHSYGQVAAKAIQESRQFFADHFKVSPAQVIFTGGGTEADNLAVYGVALRALSEARTKGTRPRVLCSAIEHPAVRQTVLSLESLGIDAQLIPVVERNGQLQQDRFLELLTPETVFVSVHRVNNIIGAVLPVEELARAAKERVPGLVFHTDAVQAFGKVELPKAGSGVDLISISGHKVEGPKGVGALIVLNQKLLKQGLRPLIWGGEQESGLRSGTQNAGLIAGFRAAAEPMLASRADHFAHVSRLRDRLREKLQAAGLLSSTFIWNSPEDAVPHIVSLCAPELPAPLLARMLDERGYQISLGSACSSGKTATPDSVLTALNLPAACRGSNLRVSFSHRQSTNEVDGLSKALIDSVTELVKMLGGPV
jgi:cysteine desulfurase